MFGAVSITRDRWLDEGLRVLATEGAAGVRIDRIAARLGLSKGSFHHHFQGAQGYKRDLLAHYEHVTIQRFNQAIDESGPPDDARAILTGLTQLIEPSATGLYRPETEAAVRAWSTSDSDVHAVQARIDRARLEALERVWRRHLPGDRETRLAALLPYLLAVGAMTVVPPIEADELRGIFEILTPLVPVAPAE